MSALLTLDDFQRNLPLMTPFDEANTVCFFPNGERNPAMCTGDANTQAATAGANAAAPYASAAQGYAGQAATSAAAAATSATNARQAALLVALTVAC